MMDRIEELRRLLAQVQERNYELADVDPRLWARQVEDICKQSGFGETEGDDNELR